MAQRSGPGRAVQLVGSLALAILIIAVTIVVVTGRIGANPELQQEREKARRDLVEERRDAAQDAREEREDR
jgi:hypothetical protein